MLLCFGVHTGTTLHCIIYLGNTQSETVCLFQAYYQTHKNEKDENGFTLRITQINNTMECRPRGYDSLEDQNEP